MGLTNYILTCEKDNERLKYELSYYKGYSKRLKEKNTKYKEVIDSAKALVNNVYNSLENADKPIKFYEELLDILNINERD